MRAVLPLKRPNTINEAVHGPLTAVRAISLKGTPGSVQDAAETGVKLNSVDSGAVGWIHGGSWWER